MEKNILQKSMLIIIPALIVIIPCRAAAQESLKLSLEQSIQIALEKNPEIQIAEKETAKAKAGIGEARAAILPSVSGSVFFQHAWEIQENVIPNFIKPMMGDLLDIIPNMPDMPDYVKISFGLENTFTYGLQLNQPLYLGGAGLAGIRMANAAAKTAQHQYESRKQGLIYRTVQVYYGCVLANELVNVQEEALKQAEANLENVLKKYEAGSASGFEKMRAEVEAANLRPSLIAARNNYQSALTALRMILGLDKKTVIQISGTLEYAFDHFADLELDVFRQMAYENRPDFKIIDAQKAMAKSGVSLAKSRFLPKVMFVTDYSFMAMKNDLNFIRDDFSKGFTSAISVQVPLFSGFRNNRGYQKARLDYRIVQDTEKQMTDGLMAEVEIAYNTFQEAKEKYVSAKESIGLAEEALRLANLMYEEGASTQLDVLGSQLALTQARMNLASALFEYQLSRYELRRATGTLKGKI